MAEKQRIPYPIDPNTVSLEQTLEEQAYDLTIEERVLNGEIHPRFIRWFKEDSSNEEPVDDSKVSKIRYRTCKLCPMFDNNLKVCEECNCFMPIKVQFKSFKCPLNKWPE